MKTRQKITRLIKFLTPVIGLTSLFFWCGVAAYFDAPAFSSTFSFIATSWALPLAVAFLVACICLTGLQICEKYYPLYPEIIEHPYVQSTSPPPQFINIPENYVHPEVAQRAHQPYSCVSRQNVSKQGVYAVQHRRHITDLFKDIDPLPNERNESSGSAKTIVSVDDEHTPPDEIRLPSEVGGGTLSKLPDTP